MQTLNLRNGFIGFIAVILGFIAKSFYRPYAYQHQLNDFGLADSAPSFFYVIGFSQLMLIKNNRYPGLVILIITVGSVLYELFQSKGQLPDSTDILASCFGGVVSLIIWKMQAT